MNAAVEMIIWAMVSNTTDVFTQKHNNVHIINYIYKRYATENILMFHRSAMCAVCAVSVQ